MKILNILYLTGLFSVLVSCQKETINTIEHTEAAKEKSTDLKLDLKTKTKTLKATDLGEKASLMPRYNHASLVFDNKMWILGGNLQSEKIPKESNDVSFSYNGAEWKVITKEANFPYRTLFGATVFKDKMWMAGGFAEDGATFPETSKNDVWCSKNGIEWKMVTPNAGFQKRFDHTLTAFNGSLWLIGGIGFNKKINNYETLSDIWRSSDGQNWVKVTDNAPFGPRRSHASVVHDGKLWVVGGWDYSYNKDVWYTKDGYQWEQATDNAAFPPRILHALTTDGKFMWLTAGHAIQDNKKDPFGHQNDIWYSGNGINWYKANTSQEFPKRTQHSSVFFNGKLWVINGFGFKDGSGTASELSDIWSFEE